MAPKWYELVTGSLEQKKQYREYKARVAALPPEYREGAAALERYLLNLGPSNDGKALIAMLSDLADLLEQSVTAGTRLRDVVGADPVDFAETFMDNYGGGSWIRKERERLRKSLAAAEAERGEDG
ncbi:DUF1048 domain-containing protein [Microbacterium sp. X-17]|uniref:DUF1048 domain-containing protein n=1 Tax=Microbacterium sp. X-17 TaxID=3144404 RepID=UPI0031F49C5D